MGSGSPAEEEPASRRPKGLREYWMRMPPRSLLDNTAPCRVGYSATGQEQDRSRTGTMHDLCVTTTELTKVQVGLLG
jgi:hypothetical protein